MFSARVFPSADEIAKLAVSAANLTGEDPIGILTSRKSTRARAYIFHLLARRYRHVPQAQLGKLIGTDGSDAQTSFLRTAPRAQWWDQLVAEQIERHDALIAARVAEAGRRPPTQVPVTAALMGDPDPTRQRPLVTPPFVRDQPRHYVDRPVAIVKRVRPALPPRFFPGEKPRAGK